MSSDSSWLSPAVAALEVQVLGAPVYGDAEDSRYQLIQRLAATTVRRAANQHGCRAASTGTSCEHPDHRRDVHYAHFLLDQLDLPRNAIVTTDEDRAEFVSGFSADLPYGNHRPTHGPNNLY